MIQKYQESVFRHRIPNSSRRCCLANIRIHIITPLKPYIGLMSIISLPDEKNRTRQYIEVPIVQASNEKIKYKKNCSLFLI